MNLFSNLLLGIALIMVIAAFFFRKQTFDIHLSDTYYVVSRPAYFFALAVVLVVLAGLYQLTAPMLSSLLAWIHVGATAAAIISFIVIAFLRPDRPVRLVSVDLMRTYATYNSLFVITMFILVFVQFVFVLNVVLGVVRKL